MKNNRESGYFLLYQEIVMQFLHDKKCRLHDDPPFFNRDRLYSSYRTEHMGPVFEGKENKRMEETKMNMSLIVVLAIMGVLAISYLGAKKNLYGMLENVNMPASAELVLPQKTGVFSCCVGSRLGIEEVYRIPADKARSISYGKEGRVVVEPFEYSCELNDLQVGGSGYESDCSYVYDYGDVMKLAGYRDDDGYLYVHVWGREYLGGEDSGILFYGLGWLSFYAIPVVVVILILKYVISRIKDKMEDKE